MTTSKSKKPRKSADVILNEYGSMNQMSTHLGIPKQTLKFASDNGCPAFKHHRIISIELIRWIFGQGMSSKGVDWRGALAKVQAEREQLKLDKERGNLASKDEISFSATKALSVLFTALDRMFKIELPPALKGLDELSIQKLLLQHDAQLKESLRIEFQGLAGQAGETKK